MNDPKLWTAVSAVIMAALAVYGQNQLYQWRVKKLEDAVSALYKWKDEHVQDYARHKARCPVAHQED